MAPRKERGDRDGREKGVDGLALVLGRRRPAKSTIFGECDLSIPITYETAPCSSLAIDITANLHNKVSKAYTVKALKEMHDRKEIEGRAAGKQIVYHALQDAPSDSTPSKLTALDQEIENLRAQLASTKAAEKSLRSELGTLNARVSTGELRGIVGGLEREREELLVRLKPLREKDWKGEGAGSQVVSAEELARVEGEWREWKGRVVGRKRICREIWERCSEVLPEGMKEREEGRQELWEGLGLEGRL
ncbi:hypothetical protein PABG_05615 [Paracoccidioides brasiliensis Pb03]|nr:hypothetical protein PABG_05615 [Paracoccidioides brasiliensis Pb03]